jgi:hypothetical protein
MLLSRSLPEPAPEEAESCSDLNSRSYACIICSSDLVRSRSFLLSSLTHSQLYPKHDARESTPTIRAPRHQPIRCLSRGAPAAYSYLKTTSLLSISVPRLCSQLSRILKTQESNFLSISMCQARGEQDTCGPLKGLGPAGKGRERTRRFGARFRDCWPFA